MKTKHLEIHTRLFLTYLKWFTHVALPCNMQRTWQQQHWLLFKIVPHKHLFIMSWQVALYALTPKYSDYIRHFSHSLHWLLPCPSILTQGEGLRLLGIKAGFTNQPLYCICLLHFPGMQDVSHTRASRGYLLANRNGWWKSVVAEIWCLAKNISLGFINPVARVCVLKWEKSCMNVFSMCCHTYVRECPICT